jgi:hypothetical protein
LNVLVRDSQTPGLQYLVVSQEQTVLEYAGAGQTSLGVDR